MSNKAILYYSLVSGLAIFSMFFGAGNLVYPIIAGVHSENFLSSYFGLFVTAVIVPILGLFAMLIYKCDKRKFFNLFGSYSPFIISLVMLILLGPFGVVPRCILISYNNVLLSLPNLSLGLYNTIFCILIYIFFKNEKQIVKILGKIFSPLMIGLLLTIIIAGLLSKSNPAIDVYLDIDSFKSGFNIGYQTMDLLAAFFFSIPIFNYVKSLTDNEQSLYKIFSYGCLVAAILIAVIYIGFAYMGFKYSAILKGFPTASYLIAIAKIVLGDIAKPFISVTVFITCITTAIILMQLFADFIYTYILKDFISKKCCFDISLITSYVMTFVGFEKITSFLAQILAYFYPLLIFIVIVRLVEFFVKKYYLKTSEAIS